MTKIYPQDIRNIIRIISLTHAKLAHVIGIGNPQLISAWVQTEADGPLQISEVIQAKIQSIIDLASMLVEVFPDQINRENFLNCPQQELGNQSPGEVIKYAKLNGVQEITILLGRMAEGLPS